MSRSTSDGRRLGRAGSPAAGPVGLDRGDLARVGATRSRVGPSSSTTSSPTASTVPVNGSGAGARVQRHAAVQGAEQRGRPSSASSSAACWRRRTAVAIADRVADPRAAGDVVQIGIRSRIGRHPGVCTTAAADGHVADAVRRKLAPGAAGVGHYTWSGNGTTRHLRSARRVRWRHEHRHGRHAPDARAGAGQPPHDRPARPARRAPRPGRGRLPAHGHHRPRQRDLDGRPRLGHRSASCSTSWSCCSSAATRSRSASIRRTIDMVKADESPSEVLTAELLRTYRGGRVRPKTSGQKRYVDAIVDQHRSPSASAPPAPASRGWPSPWPCSRCRPRRSSASC